MSPPACSRRRHSLLASVLSHAKSWLGALTFLYTKCLQSQTTDVLWTSPNSHHRMCWVFVRRPPNESLLDAPCLFIFSGPMCLCCYADLGEEMYIIASPVQSPFLSLLPSKPCASLGGGKIEYALPRLPGDDCHLGPRGGKQVVRRWLWGYICFVTKAWLSHWVHFLCPAPQRTWLQL